MSEYQYYGFLAIDRPLTKAEMTTLRGISSRANISPTSFANEYNWGDLKANPRELLRKYFDIHMYLSNWGCADFIIRIPKAALSKELLESCFSEEHLQYEGNSQTWLVHWSPMIDDGDGLDLDYEFIDRDWMPHLAPIREEILAGNLRGLYLGWLKSVQSNTDNVSAHEPFPWPALGPLTAAQESLVEFLQIDPDLLAGLDTSEHHNSTTEITAIDDWLATISRQQAANFLRHVLTNSDAIGAREIKKSFSEWQTKQNTTSKPKTVTKLLEAASQARQHRQQKQAQAARREQAKRKKIRDAWLAELAKDFETAWASAHEQAETGHAKGYDRACHQLLDLRDAYKQHSSRAAFDQGLSRFLSKHSRRRALLTRLDRAGLKIKQLV